MAKIKIGTLYYNTAKEEGEIKIDDKFDAPIIVLDTLLDCINDLTAMYNKKVETMDADILDYGKRTD